MCVWNKKCRICVQYLNNSKSNYGLNDKFLSHSHENYVSYSDFSFHPGSNLVAHCDINGKIYLNEYTNEENVFKNKQKCHKGLKISKEIS